MIYLVLEENQKISWNKHEHWKQKRPWIGWRNIFLHSRNIWAGWRARALTTPTSRLIYCQMSIIIKTDDEHCARTKTQNHTRVEFTFVDSRIFRFLSNSLSPYFLFLTFIGWNKKTWNFIMFRNGFHWGNKTLKLLWNLRLMNFY